MAGTGATPVPVRATVWGELDKGCMPSLSVTLKVVPSAPLIEGAEAMTNVQVEFAARVPVGYEQVLAG